MAEVVRRLSDEEQRERTAVYDGWWRCETIEDVEEHERLVDRWAQRHPGMVVDQSDATADLRSARESARGKETGGPENRPARLSP